MTRVGFETTIPVFERAKTVHALDRAAIVIDKDLLYPIDILYHIVILIHTTLSYSLGFLRSQLNIPTE
jgi:hypothetical protein